MKRAALAAGLSLALATAANAADMPLKAAPVYLPPPISWTGPYVGGNLGGAWFDPSFSTDVPSVPVGGKKPPPHCDKYCMSPDPLFGIGGGSSGGFVGGIQGGYNYQFAPAWIAGIEADFDAADLKSTGSIGQLSLPNSSANISQNIDWLATLRGRVGYLLWPSLMLYGTGGVAWGDFNYSASANVTSAISASTSFSDVRTGWVAGGGAEYMLTPNWLLRAEYLYYSFAGASTSAALSPAVTSTPLQFSWSRTNLSVIRFGADFHF
jgi:outer membrane immunogenic protein